MTVAHLYYVALSFLSGVLLTSFIFFTIPFLITLVLVATVLLIIFYSTLGKQRDTVFFWVALSILFFSVGGLRMEQATHKLNQTTLHNLVETEVILEGIVKEEPIKSETSLTFYVTLSDTVLMVRTDAYTSVNYGDVVQVSGKLTKPDDFETDLGRTFAYTKYLAVRGVVYQVELAKVKIISTGAGNIIVHQLFKFKEKFLNGLYGVLPEPASGLAAGLVLGVKDALGNDLEKVFRQAGIIHIVVLSGYNVMLVVIFVMLILKPFLSKHWRLWVGIISIILFALLVGLSATVVRACVMASLLLIMETFGRTYIILRGLILSAVGMLLINPLLLAFDIGFQLSFLATLGLILIAPWLEEKFSKIPNPYEMRNFLIATIATQLAVLPLLLFQIGEVSLVAIVVNVLVLPLVAVVMLLILGVGLASMFLPTLATFIGYGAYALLMYIINIATLFAGLPFASVKVPAFPWWVMIFMYVGLFIWYWRLQKNQKDIDVVTETDLLAGWEIVEDIEEDNEIKTGETKKFSPADIPIFFR